MELTPDGARERLYELAEDASVAGLLMGDAMSAVRDGYNSVAADRDTAEDLNQSATVPIEWMGREIKVSLSGVDAFDQFRLTLFIDGVPRYSALHRHYTDKS